MADTLLTEDGTTTTHAPGPAAAPVDDTAARERAEYVLTMLGQLGNRHRMRALTVLYNAPNGLPLPALAEAVGKEEDQTQTLVDRLVKASLVSVLPVLDDDRLGWETRYLATPAAREWLERVAVANGQTAVVPA